MSTIVSDDLIKETIKNVFVKAICEVPPDVIEAIEGALEKESNPRARNILEILLQNASAAKEKKNVICQDTGVPVFFIKTPLGFPFNGDFKSISKEAVREVTMNFPLRPMMVHPLNRSEFRDNTGPNMPILHYDIDQDASYIEITAVPKGAGSGFWGTVKFIPPPEGVPAVKKFIIDSVIRAGSNPCPPIIVGVGIGGNLEEVTRLATVASFRPLNIRHPEQEIATIEEDLLEAINASKIGPMGLGGDHTAFAVNIEYTFTHKPWIPVAVNIQCWPGRQASARIYSDGKVEYI